MFPKFVEMGKSYCFLAFFLFLIVMTNTSLVGMRSLGNGHLTTFPPLVGVLPFLTADAYGGGGVGSAPAAAWHRHCLGHGVSATPARGTFRLAMESTQWDWLVDRILQ